MDNMTSRQRVLTALNHHEPDKIPIDVGSTTVSSITIPAYENIQRFAGLEPEANPHIAHVHQGVVWPREELLRRYESDFRSISMKKSPRGHIARELPDGSFYDEYGMMWKKSLYDYYPASAPLADCKVEDLKKVTWPDPCDRERVKGLREEAKALCEKTDFAIVGDIIDRGPFELAVKLRGFEQFLTDLHLEPDFCLALLDKITETNIALWEIYLHAIGDHVQVVCQGDDVGMQTSLIMSPALYRRFIKPCHKRIFDFIHGKTKAKVFLHSCGSVYDIIPDLIEIGVDILNPIQRSAAKMDVVKLKKEFGKELCFWGGGIDTQQFLPTASLAEIEAEVKRTIDILAPGGGFVFVPTHNIQPDISPERFDKVYSTALRYRDYTASAGISPTVH